MNRAGQDTAIIISHNAKTLNTTPIWGTGGWLPPADREELDWKTLLKWMGWKSKLLHPEDFNVVLFNEKVKWVILSGDVDSYDRVFIDALFDIVDHHRILLLSKAGKKNSYFSQRSGVRIAELIEKGNQFYGMAPALKKKWQCKTDIAIPVLDLFKDSANLVLVNNRPIVAVSKGQIGKWAILSFDPGSYRDKAGCFTSILKYILVYQSCVPVAFFNFDNTVILRMDDPGSAEPVYHSIYKNTRLNKWDWHTIGKTIRERNARITLGYVPGWVDDGDVTRSKLWVNGTQVTRSGLTVYPSNLIRYELFDDDSKKTYDYEEEFASIDQLRQKGLVETELHGYTHIHPDKQAWLASPDKHSSKNWYREFGRNTLEYVKSLPESQHPFDKGLQLFTAIFDNFPTTLICPGDEFTKDVLQKALTSGLLFVSSYYLAMKIDDKLCWDQHVCAPYLSQPDAGWFDAGLPVVGYFHDFDISINGMNWFTDCLDDWSAAGAKYFVDFRELAGILSHSIGIEKKENGYELSTIREEKWNPVKACRIEAYFPEKNITIDYECDLNKNKHILTAAGTPVSNKERVCPQDHTTAER